MDDANYIILFICAILILSYLFTIFASKIKIPSVILLITLGLVFQYISNMSGIDFFPENNVLLETLGITGLIFIVLEEALHLKIDTHKLKTIGNSIASATIVLIITSGVITIVLQNFIDLPIRTAILFAIPLGIMSSAVAIPSIHHIAREKKEFITYESTFSDIIGVLLFNYILINSIPTLSSIFGFVGSLIFTIIISIIVSYILLFLLKNIEKNIKFFFIFSILLGLYSVGKIVHLSPLILILIFGIVLNNTDFFNSFYKKYIHVESNEKLLEETRLITSEFSFFIRTFFFVLFGYNIHIYSILTLPVIKIGLIILSIIYLIRIIVLLPILSFNIFPEFIIAPRGLITIVLFYSIPVALRSGYIISDILSFVILSTIILMAIGLMFVNKAVQTSSQTESQ